jgi:hypothetical protein
VVLVIESVDGFCNFLSYLAGSYFCVAAAPPGMLGSLNGLLSAAILGAGEVHRQFNQFDCAIIHPVV